MKKTLTSLLFLSILALASCAAPIAPAPASAPTLAPTAAPAVEAPAAEAPAPVPPPTDELVMLRANTWQWVSFTSPIETFNVETPGSYTATFNSDASLAIVADCNNAAGAYQGEGGKLSIEIGPMTAAACPPESRSAQFVKLLSGGVLYFFQDGKLHIDLAADGGTMVFAPVAASAAAQTKPQAIAGKTVPCTMPLPPSEIDGETIVCGAIQVPEDWDNPASTPLTITYAVQLSTSKPPFADPVIFFSGGPGASLLSAIGHSKYDFSYLRDKRDVIIFDQRGNRFSSDLRCPEKVRNPDPVARQAAMDAYPKYQFTADSDPVEAVNYFANSPDLQYLSACAKWFAEQGRDLKEYNTANTVRDSIALMKHLGYPAYNLFGISYGTQIVQQMLDYYHNTAATGLPEVRTALIDGVVPLNIPSGFLETSFNVPLGVLRFFDACEADAACAAAYPDSRQRTIDLLAKLEQAPLVLNGGEQIGTQELSQLFMTAFFTKRGDIIAYFPRMVAELEAGDASTYHVAMALLAGRLPPATEPKSAATPFEPLNTEVAAAASEPRDLAADTSSAELQQTPTLPERYLRLLDDAMARMKPDKRDGFGNSLIAYMDDEALRTRQGLIDITNSLAGPVAGAEMVSVVNEMSDAEVTQVFATVASDDFVQPLIMTEDFVSMAILCNDRIAYTSIAEYQELLRSFPAPQLGIDTSGLPFNIASCRVFGLGEPNGSAAPVGVTSDVPTLVFNGMLDASTPVEWASLAIPNLSDVRMETFPMAGHGATRYSQCAKDIAAAFFTYPERKYDDSCVAELQPPFVLPDDALPQIPAATPE